jgi:hypothetical protein
MANVKIISKFIAFFCICIAQVLVLDIIHVEAASVAIPAAGFHPDNESDAKAKRELGALLAQAGERSNQADGSSETHRAQQMLRVTPPSPSPAAEEIAIRETLSDPRLVSSPLVTILRKAGDEIVLPRNRFERELHVAVATSLQLSTHELSVFDNYRHVAQGLPGFAENVVHLLYFGKSFVPFQLTAKDILYHSTIADLAELLSACDTVTYIVFENVQKNGAIQMFVPPAFTPCREMLSVDFTTLGLDFGDVESVLIHAFSNRHLPY